MTITKSSGAPAIGHSMDGFVTKLMRVDALVQALMQALLACQVQRGG